MTDEITKRVCSRAALARVCRRPERTRAKAARLHTRLRPVSIPVSNEILDHPGLRLREPPKTSTRRKPAMHRFASFMSRLYDRQFARPEKFSEIKKGFE